MGNLEKAGVLVVVALLAVILVVAFLNFPDQHQSPALSAGLGRQAQADAKKPVKKNEPANPMPDAPDVVKPKPDADRPSSDAPPQVVSDPMAPLLSGLTPPKRDDVVLPIPAPPKVEPPKDPPKPPPWPKTIKVAAGESLWGIAVREYGPTVGPKMVNAITAANPKARPEALKLGTELTLPAPPEAAAVAKTADATASGKAAGGDDAKKPAKPAAKEKDAATPSSKPARKLPFVPE
jgi:LysM repeat protein